jgi:hypothetical protein
MEEMEEMDGSECLGEKDSEFLMKGFVSIGLKETLRSGESAEL